MFRSLLRPILRASYENTNDIQTVAQNVYLKPPGGTVNILSAPCCNKISNYAVVKKQIN